MKKGISAFIIIWLITTLLFANAFFIFTNERFGEISFLINTILGIVLGGIGTITWFKINNSDS